MSRIPKILEVFSPPIWSKKIFINKLHLINYILSKKKQKQKKNPLKTTFCGP